MAENFRPAQGLIRLTWPQVEKIQAKFARLYYFVSHGDSQAQLVIVVRRGKVRFGELEFSADGDLNGGSRVQLPWSAIEKIDARLSSLCGFTEGSSGEARLILSLDGRGEIEMKMALSEELGPAR